MLDEQHFQLFPILITGSSISQEKISESAAGGGIASTVVPSGVADGGFDRRQTLCDAGLDAFWE